MALTRAEKLVSLGTPPQAAKEILRQINAQIGNGVYLTALGMSGPLSRELASQITLGDMPPDDAIDRLVSMGVLPRVAELIVGYIAAGGGPAPELPGVITDLTAFAISATQVQLSFTPSTNATSHHYRRALAGTGNWTTPAILVSTTISGLTPETDYDFQVRGVNIVGASAWSNIATVQLGSAPTVPDQVVDLNAEPINESSVSLTFTPVDDTTSYESSFSLAGVSEWSAPATLMGNTISGLDPETGYDFRVRGVNDAGPAEWSNLATAYTSPLAPTIDLEPASDTGISDTDGITMIVNPILDVTSTLNENDILHVYVDDNLFRSHLVTAQDVTDGIDLSLDALADDTYDIYFRREANGSVSAPSNTEIITVDTQAPFTTSLNPAHNQADVAVDASPAATFDQTIAPGSSMTVGLYNASGPTLIEAFDETDLGGALVISGDTLTINPTADFPLATALEIQIASGSIIDVAGNEFAGIASGAWQFYTSLAGQVAWDPEQKHENVILSDFNRTATNNGVAANATRVRATTAVASGRYYLEFFHELDGGGSNNDWCGFCNAAFNVTAVNPTPDSSSNTITVRRSDGVIRYNNTTLATLAQYLGGITICACIDMTQGLIWFRRQAGGDWNGNASADPDTDVGGLPVSVIGDLFPLATVARSNSQFVLRTADSEFVGVRPTTFSPYGDLS